MNNDNKNYYYYYDYYCMLVKFIDTITLLHQIFITVPNYILYIT